MSYLAEDITVGDIVCPSGENLYDVEFVGDKGGEEIWFLLWGDDNYWLVTISRNEAVRYERVDGTRAYVLPQGRFQIFPKE